MRDIKTLDLNLLKALDALLDERSVTRAAARLSLTQPAVSGMLTRLRDSFGDPLFVRNQRGIIPTPRALELALPVKKVLDEIGELLQPALFDPATAAMTVSIAATDYALKTILVPFLARLREVAPGIRVAIHPVEDDRLQGQLESGELDLVLITPEVTLPGLHARRLFDERYVSVMRSSHPAATTGSLTLAQFCQLDHAIVSYVGGRFRGATDIALAQQGLSRHVTLSVNSFTALTEILLITDLIAVMPERLVRHQPGLICMEPPLPISGFTKVAAWHDRTHHDSSHAWVRAFLFEICSGLA